VGVELRALVSSILFKSPGSTQSKCDYTKTIVSACCRGEYQNVSTDVASENANTERSGCCPVSDIKNIFYTLSFVSVCLYS